MKSMKKIQKISTNKRLLLIAVGLVASLAFCTDNTSAQSITVNGDYSPTYDGSVPWNIAGFLEVGDTSSGSIYVNDGAAINAGFARLGGFDGGDGYVFLNGAGTEFNVNTGYLDIGSGGDGGISIANQASVTSISTVVGNDSLASGAVLIDGNNSRWQNTDLLYVGYAGQGGVIIDNGGSLTTATTFIGHNSGSGGYIQVCGAGSTFDSQGPLYVGYSSNDADLRIQEGGMVSSTDVYLGALSGSEGTVAVYDADSIWNISSELRIGNQTTIPSDSSVTLNGGQINSSGQLNIFQGGSFILDGGRLNASQVFLDSAGEFRFDDGILNVQTFDGDLIQYGGMLAPGDSPGLTSILGDYSQSSSGSIEFELAGLVRGTEYDAIDVDGFAALNGIVDINLIDGFAPEAGDTFFLVNASAYDVGVTFNFEDAMLGNGLAWDTSSFSDNGTLSVVSAVPEPGSLGFVLALVAGSMLKRRNRGQAS